MTVEEIIEYVIHTPGNTNPNVLKTFVEALASEGGSGSSDISYANILIDNKTGFELFYTLPLINEEENLVLSSGGIGANGNILIQVPLYKNKIVLEELPVYLEDRHPLFISV